MGASGRMGQEIAALLSDGFTIGTDAFELSDGITQSGRLLSLEGMSLRKLEDPEREPVHVWIDFSRPEGTLALLEKIDCPIVIGTTGFTGPQHERIESFAKRQRVLLCPNTSPGMNWMQGAMKHTGHLAALDFAAVLEDEHHKNKKDAPSGTAKRLLQALTGAGFDAGKVQVHVTRAGSIVGNHKVRFIADGEELSIEHRVTDRRIFAKGALRGAHFLLQQTKPKLYTFDEVEVGTSGGLR